MAQVETTDAFEPSKLQRKLALQIVEFIQNNHLQKGDHLTELGLAEALNVSRTPVRRALEYLSYLNVVAPGGPRRGFQVIGVTDALDELTEEAAQSDEEGEVYIRIASDYVAQRLPDQFSEADMMRQYAVGRSILLRVLQRMARERVIERNPGYGWRFAPLLRSLDSHDKSYRFRLAVEPAAIMEPTFELDRDWAQRSRRDHAAVLASPPDTVSMVQFFEMNAQFHGGLAACSGNEFFREAVDLQNQLRRFLSYNLDTAERLADSCLEHMQILDAVEQGEREWAAQLMRRHLEKAAREKP